MTGWLAIFRRLWWCLYQSGCCSKAGRASLSVTQRGFYGDARAGLGSTQPFQMLH